jgi:hypothetical protein
MTLDPGRLSWRAAPRLVAGLWRIHGVRFDGYTHHVGFTNRAMLVAVVIALVAGLVAGLSAHALAASRPPQEPGPLPVPVASPLPSGTAGPVRVRHDLSTPEPPAGTGRWRLIATTFFGGSDGLDDGTHHFADGGTFVAGTWAIASGPDLKLGTWLELRWHGTTVTAEVRDRHGRSAAPFFDLTLGLATALFGKAGNHTIAWRLAP